MTTLALIAGASVARLAPVRLQGGVAVNDIEPRTVRTCRRCGISDWHPEARSCTAADCEMRRPA